MEFLIKDDEVDALNSINEVAATNRKSEEKCNAIRFSDICNLFEKMSKLQGSASKLKMLFTKELKKHLAGQSIFPLLRLVLPLNDTERGKYGLKQASIAKTYVGALHLDKNSEDAKRLLNWKDPTKNQGVELSKLVTGDFGLILEDVLKSRVRSEPSTITLLEVNRLLDELANAITVDDKTNLIRTKVLNDFNAIEQKWLVRIIFQDLKIGLKHENVLRAFYPNALKRFNECTNLRTVCEEEGQVSNLTGIQLFINFSPMLAKGFPNASLGQVNTVENAMENSPFVMDLKLDGERILCHIGDDNSFTLFTRRGNDYTDNYWPVAHNIIMSLRKKGHNFSCILDGEICAIDSASKNFLPFGQNLSVARVEREYGEDKPDDVNWYKDLPHWMTFVMFDIIYIDGEGSEEIIAKSLQDCGVVLNISPSSGEISHLPLAVRRRILMNIIEIEQHRVELVPCRFVTSSDSQERKSAIEDYFNEITLAGKEGLVIKNLTSPYEFGEKSRGKGYWVKMKPEYGDHAEDLDLLVLAAYYGEGQNLRGEGLSTFLLGVKDDKDPNHFQTLCKVGTGYSFQELTELREKINEVCVPWDAKSPPEHLAHWKIAKRDDRPNVYIPPEKSFVMQLKCAEIVDSVSFSCGLTCRFPRVQRIRYDKSFRDILSVSDIIAAKNRPRNVVAASSYGEGNDKGEPERKKKRNAGANNQGNGFTKRDQTIDDQFRLTSLKKVQQEGRIFVGATFCVLENDFLYTTSTSIMPVVSTSSASSVNMQRKYSRDQIMKDIKLQGGEVVANASVPGCIVIAGNKRTVQIKNLIEQGEKDVIDFSYIIDCLDAGYKLPLRGFYFLSISNTTRRIMKGQLDPFGDSYHEDVTPTELTKIMKNIDDTIIRLEKYAGDVTKKKPTKLLGNRGVKDQQESKDAILFDNGDRAIVDMWNELKHEKWRKIVSQHFVEEERDPIYHQGNCLYREGIVIYFDIFNDFGSCECDPMDRFKPCADIFCNDIALLDPSLNGIRLAMIKSLYYRMVARGAIISDHLHGEVTHIVMFNQMPIMNDRKNAIQDRIRLLRRLEMRSFEKRIVNEKWLLDCITAEELVDVVEHHLISFS